MAVPRFTAVMMSADGNLVGFCAPGGRWFYRHERPAEVATVERHIGENGLPPDVMRMTWAGSTSPLGQTLAKDIGTRPTGDVLTWQFNEKTGEMTYTEQKPGRDPHVDVVGRRNEP